MKKNVKVVIKTKEFKECHKCGINKHISNFYTKRHFLKTKDEVHYYRSQCKSCINRINEKNVVKYKKKFPEKNKARILVRDALKSGELKKTPCIVCKDKRVDGHHPDYSKPLEVLWLCKTHHNDIHYGRLLINIK